MATKRSYEDGCTMAHALDLIGERWALLVVRALLLGPRRFTDLRRSMPSISPNVLSQRLRELEETAIVRRRKLAPPAGSWVYELTDWGLELEPVIIQLGRWGARSPFMPEVEPRTDSVVLSFRTLFSAEAADGLSADYELRFGEESFHISVAGGRIGIVRGSADRPDAVIDTDPATLAGLIFGGRDLVEAQHAGTLRLWGDVSAVARFLTLFPLPEPAPVG